MEKNIPHNNDWQKRLRQQPFEFDPEAWEDMERLLDKEEDRKGGYLSNNGHGKWIVGYMILFLMLAVVAGAWYQSRIPAEKIVRQEVSVATVQKEEVDDKTVEVIIENKEKLSVAPVATLNKTEVDQIEGETIVNDVKNKQPTVNYSSRSDEGQNINASKNKTNNKNEKIKENKNSPAFVASSENPEVNNNSIAKEEKNQFKEPIALKKDEDVELIPPAKIEINRSLMAALDLIPIKNNQIIFESTYQIDKNLITPNSPRSRITFGVYGGSSLRTLNTVQFTLDNNGGETARAQNFDYSLGVFARKSISRRLSLQAALEVSQSKYRYAILGIDSVPNTGVSTPVFTNSFNYLERSTYRTINFDLPVTLHYHLKKEFRVFAGLGTQYHFNRVERSNEDEFEDARSFLNLADPDLEDYDNRVGATVNSTAGLPDFKFYGMLGVGYTKGRWNIDLSAQHSLFYKYKLKGFEKGMNKIRLNEFGANLRIGYRLSR